MIIVCVLCVEGVGVVRWRSSVDIVVLTGDVVEGFIY